MKKNLAIIGSGIAGMSAAYFLKDEFNVTVYEKNDYIGGHTNTVYVDEDGVDIPIDTGFMVFNEVTYPYLCKLFKKLEVPYKNTDMSFGVSHAPSGWEYNGSNISGLFSQRKNIINPRFINFLLHINKFNKNAPSLIEELEKNNVTIKEFIAQQNLSQDFYERFLVPMSSAVWSTPFEKMGDFPASSLIRFFYNHGFMGLDTQHQWKTVIGGSESYKKRLINSFIDQIKVNCAAIEVEDKNEKVVVKDITGESLEYDKVIFASHGDETLGLIKNPTSEQANHLKNFKYQENIAVLHTDESVMPKTKEVWSSWNYLIPNKEQTFTVYWMNRLQHVSEKKNYFININGENYVDKSKVLKRIVYHHPLFDQAAIKSQKTLFDLNTQATNLYFCGSYFRYGFHEDALMSSVKLCSFLLDREVL